MQYHPKPMQTSHRLTVWLHSVSTTPGKSLGHTYSPSGSAHASPRLFHAPSSPT
ncbi:hypothetical protein M406DRAFT_323869 [Cryphonectria parasitica EP155]|uniref:Uncharacterized protein n=1 Tax=Cryphonectria parasitica (strain ATCC 38755 / EP155) TaxID=660469 RepID=A0A9P4XV20_CRYP1|nr:uncharacterized protein M406DRAFT_323869 [Cryphonectria parasitica EP155]KAF3761446.1 hypothetical protein M406DRAFT_323869 [Cryphonectria parasitica EP155]